MAASLSRYSVLSAQNASQIKLLAQIGLGTPLCVAWREDAILVAWSTGIARYDPSTLEQAGFVTLALSQARDVCFSQDGTKLAARTVFSRPAGEKGPPSVQVYLLDPLSGKALSALGPRLPLGDFSLSRGCERLLTYQPRLSGLLQVWEAGAGQPVFEYTAPNDRSIIYAVLSPDGRLLGMHEQNRIGWLQVLSVETGQVVAEFQSHALVHQALFSPDGRRVTMWSEDTLELFDLEKKTRLALLRPGVLCFSPDSQRLAWSDGRGTALLRSDGEKLPSIPTGHRFAAFSPDSRQLFLLAADGLEVWDAATGRQVLSGKLPTPLPEHTRLAFSPDGAVIADLQWNGSIQLWDWQANHLMWNTIQDISLGGYKGWQALDVPSLRAGPHVVGLAFDTHTWRPVEPFTGAAHTWQVAQGARLRSQHGNYYLVSFEDVAFHPVARLLVHRLSYPHEVIVVDRLQEPPERQVLLERDNPHAAFEPTTLAFSADGRLVLVAMRRGRVIVWDSRRQQRVFEVEKTNGRAALHSPGRYVAVQNQLYSLLDGRPLLDAGPQACFSAFSPQANLWLTWGDTTTEVKVWDIERRKQVGAFPAPQEADQSVVFSPDGRLIATGSRTDPIQVWGVSRSG